MEITDSARKHGIADDDILHAWRNQLRYALLEYKGELQYLAIGPDCSGTLLELVVPCDDPRRVIHADILRQKFYRYLQ
ncbi:hypothetical protein [Mycolicibacterium palauense]|uniref:hypothetical protein n=1 Tax=Mycolicibacterium palauense TaxID=2034511 RepID=UPI000BFEB27A|nr:hypothetical protein [Mycolicibacterium palauense]